jgi:hypothetical protein
MKSSEYFQRQPHPYNKGDKVRDIFTNKIFVVERSYWQDYAGGDTADYTVVFEAMPDQPTPWNKSRNLEVIPL